MSGFGLASGLRKYECAAFIEFLINLERVTLAINSLERRVLNCHGCRLMQSRAKVMLHDCVFFYYVEKK